MLPLPRTVDIPIRERNENRSEAGFPSPADDHLDVALDYTNSKYQEALDRIAEASISAGVVPGLYFVPPGLEPKGLIERGFRFFTLPWRGWAKEGIKAGLELTK